VQWLTCRTHDWEVGQRPWASCSHQYASVHQALSSIIWYLARAFMSMRRLWQPWHGSSSKGFSSDLDRLEPRYKLSTLLFYPQFWGLEPPLNSFPSPSLPLRRLNDDDSGRTSTIADDWMLRGMNHRLRINRRKSAVDEIKLVGTKQRRPDRFDLHVRERLADASVTTGAERNVTKLLLAASSLHVQKPAPTFTKKSEKN